MGTTFFNIVYFAVTAWLLARIANAVERIANKE